MPYILHCIRTWLGLCCLALSLIAASPAAAENATQEQRRFLPWFNRVFVQVYASQMANMEMGDFLYNQRNLTKVMQDYMVTVGFGAEKNLWGGFALGMEANAGLHWGYERDPNPFAEFSAALVLRYYFPWSKTYLPSVAFGDGVSYTTLVPEYEKRYGTGDKKERMDSQWLNFLFVEFELLNIHNISLFYRVHHRCTIFGLVGADLPGGINFHSVGLRYSF